MPWPCESGLTKLTALKAAVGDRFTQMGQMHWGTTTDVGLLAEALNIGFIVFSSLMQGDGRWIYGLNLKRAEFPFWILLYNSNEVHFQVPVLSNQEVLATPTSVYQTSELPRALAQHFELCNKMTIGQRDRGGVN